ncbi:hypothetical protein GCM10023155_46530 [Bremerella cremea]
MHDGSVIFSPADGNGVAESGKVVEGNYELKCVPGEKSVKIAGYTAEKKVVPVSYVMDPAQLTANVTEDTQLDFELSSKSKRRRR